MLLLILSTLSPSAQAYDLLDTDPDGEFTRLRVGVGGFIQPRFSYSPDDAEANTLGEVGFNVTRVRLEQDGTLEGPGTLRWKIGVEMMPEARLQDAYIDYRQGPVGLRVGQFKAPTNRSLLASDRRTLFPDRGQIADLLPAREMGAMLYSSLGENHVELQAAAFNGEGRNRLSNVNRKFLYVWRAVYSPVGGPGSTAGELLSPNDPFTVSFGYAGHLNVTGRSGQESATIGHNGEFFLHWRELNLQAEVLWRRTDWQAVAIPDYDQFGWYAQAGVFVPGSAWTHEHLALLARYQQIDELIPLTDDVALVSADDPAQARRSLSFGATLYAGEAWFSSIHDLRLSAVYSHNTELEDHPYDNDSFILSAHLSF